MSYRRFFFQIQNLRGSADRQRGSAWGPWGFSTTMPCDRMCRTLLMASLGVGLASAPAMGQVEPAQPPVVDAQASRNPNANQANPKTQDPNANQAKPNPIQQMQERLFGDDKEPILLQSASLTPADVLAAVCQAYPKIQAARAESQVADGTRQSAQGWWDPKVETYTLNQPLGFYRNYRQGIGLARNLWWGGYLSSGYRLGRGEFQPWYKERETDEGGEFKIGWVQPLLQGYRIDPQRVALFQAGIYQQEIGPLVQLEVLDGGQGGYEAYWSWVAAGLRTKAQEELLRLATLRVQQIDKLIEAGDEMRSTKIFNEQLIAERKLKLLDTHRKLRDASFKLSLYLRDEQAQPIIPPDAWLPMRFPAVGELEGFDIDDAIRQAYDRRPELTLLELAASSTELELRLARNQMLPEFDFLLENSQDVGDPASGLADKSRFETEIGFQGSLPLPRNKARGKIQSSQGKLNQLAFKRQMQSDRIAVEIRSASNALQIAGQKAKQAEVTLNAATRFLELAERGFQLGEFDLVDINILESKTYDARFALLDAYEDWFSALAQLQAALGLDPLDQSVLLTEQLLAMPAMASEIKPLDIDSSSP